MFNFQTETDEPDWRLLRAARRERMRGRRRTRMAIVRFLPRERDAFYRRAYSEDQTPSLLLRRFAEAYVAGASVPALFGAAAPLTGAVNSSFRGACMSVARAGEGGRDNGQRRAAPLRADLCAEPGDRRRRAIPSKKISPGASRMHRG